MVRGAMNPVQGDLSLVPQGQRLRTLHRLLREAILDGRLKEGIKLPSSRRLAHGAGVARNTAVAAYDTLLGEGYGVARRGSGVYVAAAPRARAQRVSEDQSPDWESLTNPWWRNVAVAPSSASPPTINLSPGLPDAEEMGSNTISGSSEGQTAKTSKFLRLWNG